MRTPITIFPNNRRYWIAWDLKDIRTWTPAELAKHLHPAGPWQPLVRLREGMALELQQKMLADLGRVGQIAKMPATFPVRVELLKVEADGKWVMAPLEALYRDGGVCFVGRDDKAQSKTRLVISEAACDEITAFIAALEEDQVPENARAALGRLEGATDLFVTLEGGLDVTSVKENYSPINDTRRVGDKDVSEPVAHLARNPKDLPNAQAQKKGVVALVLRDLPQALAARTTQSLADEALAEEAVAAEEPTAEPPQPA